MKKENEKEQHNIELNNNNENNDIDNDIIDNKSEATEEMKLEEKADNKDNNKNKKKKKRKKKKVIEIEEETEEDKLIKETMGFNKFSSSKGKSHKDCDVSAVFLGRKAKRIYQRFMNYKPFSKILKQAYMSLNQEF